MTGTGDGDGPGDDDPTFGTGTDDDPTSDDPLDGDPTDGDPMGDDPTGDSTRGTGTDEEGPAGGAPEAGDGPSDGAAAGGDGPATVGGAGGARDLDAPVDPERVLLGGEDIERVVGAGRGWVAVTSHRLLAFDPGSDGRRLRDPNRLNVDSVRATASGSPRLFRWVLRAAVYGVVLFGGGLLARAVGFASLLDAPGEGPLAPLLSVVDTLLELLVVGLLLAGAVGLVVALVLGAIYLWRRERTLTVDLAGERTVEVPVGDTDGSEAAETLNEALNDDLRIEE